ncbi:efflux RND transporter periplasmic adaptor subunit [Frateuria sp. STR12]|uniref:efflux RND transporter periplasmic adaptor subunit n=1 Tax=Frateuria hangzhouensis TaxID=2995589 RepID=UPI002260CECD|nr:efflux RND transporter periplasmic adaptor subunit [Frateuria sp. STR12]MCX7515235.1 efflux RND transporter periplasmic adaptor subunit [Frateuria sp. STR12]
MNRFRFLSRLALLAPGLLLAACGGGSGGGDNASGGADQTVAVTTTMPRQQVFHDTVEAWGSVDPLHPVTINLAHAGQVTALAVAPGQAVKRGTTLLTVTPDPATRSAFVQAQNAARTAAGDLKRIEQLAADRLATQSQLAGARKALADARAALEAQRALGGANTREEVKAPLDGVVTTLQVQVGERFAANAPLLAFTPTNALLARLGVQPQDAAKLRVGLPVQLREVFSEGHDMPAHLSMVGKAIDPTSRLLPVLAEVPAASATPIAGTALSAVIQTADYRAWAVPRAAVLHDEKGDYLFVVEHGKARRVAVTLRHPEGEVVGVQGALEASSQVIVQGVYELNDGDAVHMAPAEGRAK